MKRIYKSYQQETSHVVINYLECHVISALMTLLGKSH